MDFKAIPTVLAESADVVEIKCPICGGDRVEPLEGNRWECCTCGMIFQMDYQN